MTKPATIKKKLLSKKPETSTKPSVPSISIEDAERKYKGIKAKLQAKATEMARLEGQLESVDEGLKRLGRSASKATKDLKELTTTVEEMEISIVNDITEFDKKYGDKL